MSPVTFANRWNLRIKRLIRDSRVYSTAHVVEAMGRARGWEL